MELKTRKIIAREFLLLVATLMLVAVAYFFTFLYNYYQQNQISNFSDQVSKQQLVFDSLTSKYNSKVQKQEWLHAKLINEFDVGADPNYSTNGMWTALIRIAENDSVTIRWKSKWEIGIRNFFQKQGFNNPDDLKKFILANKITSIDLENKQKAEPINTKIAELLNYKKSAERSLLPASKQYDIALWTGTILMIVLFILRYGYYGVKWSFKTLKQTNS